MPTEINKINYYIKRPTKAAPLAVFRVLFGLIMFISTVRFWYNGWIEKIYIDPKFHFHYLGFEFIEVPGQFTYVLFALIAALSLMIVVGYKHRWSMSLFFIAFTYVELMDKTSYLNHYYFVSVVSFLMIWLPMTCTFSLDAYYRRTEANYVPWWTIGSIQCLIGMVYVYAGLAKLNYDWLYKAMPLTLWLPAKQDIPILSALFQHKWVHFAFSWSGAAYDLLIVFFLMWSVTRIWAFLVVLLFHVLTAILFPIGMFPYLMILAVLIFFSGDFHERCIKIMRDILSRFKIGHKDRYTEPSALSIHRSYRYVAVGILMVQLLVPLRGLAYPGNIFWTEQGYRFSWRVMLMEKTGYANFKVVDGETGKFFYVQNEDFLTAFQQKEMSTQADFIIEYAHILRDHFANQGHQNIEIYVESYASLNGRPSQPFIDPTIDLTKVQNSLRHRTFVIPLRDEK